MDNYNCMECGMNVKPTEFHDFKCCKKYKLAKKLVRMSEFQDRLNKTTSLHSSRKLGGEKHG